MSPDKGAHRAVTIALEAGLPLKIAAREPPSGRTDAHARPRTLAPIASTSAWVSHGEKVELLQHARATVFPISAGALRARNDRVDGLRHAGGRHQLGRRAGSDRRRPHRHHRRRLAGHRGSTLSAPTPLILLRCGAVSRSASRRSGWSTTSPHTRPQSPPECGSACSTTARSSDSRFRRWRAAAEPLYLLVDTAIVGHLGREQLAALAIAATVLSTVFGPSTSFSTGRRRRSARSGGREERVANRLGAQALWLSLGFGLAIAIGVAALAPQIVELMGGEDETAGYAVTYMRIAALGLPMAFLALGAALRGVADLRTPLVIVIAANAVNVVLEVLFVYGFGWGIEGSAWGR